MLSVGVFQEYSSFLEFKTGQYFKKGIIFTNHFKFLGPVVQSIVSLTSSLRGQLIKCFTT